MFDAIIFDMDGLLIDSEPFWRRSQVKAFKIVGVGLSEADMMTTMGRRIDEVVAHWHHERPWEGTSQKDVEAMIVDGVIELVKQEGKPRSGAIAALEYFKDLGLPIAIASSSSMEIIDAVVDALSIRPYFDELFSAEHETHGKPHPGVFITTAQHLNVQPHKCLVFEDSPSGVLAAKAAKMMCIAVPEPETKEHSFIQTADVILDSLEDLDATVLETLAN